MEDEFLQEKQNFLISEIPERSIGGRMGNPHTYAPVPFRTSPSLPRLPTFEDRHLFPEREPFICTVSKPHIRG